MKRINTKSLMIFTLLFASIVSMPMIAMGQEINLDNPIDADQFDAGVFSGFRRGFGGIFSSLGHTGAILGTLFKLLFFEGLNFSSHEMLDNVFVLSANITENKSGIINFGPTGSKEYYFLPKDYTIPAGMGYAYCEVEKEGVYQYDLEIGAAITLVIWDNDGSFINAISKLMGFFRRVIIHEELGMTMNQDFIREGISLLTWFLIHINDIFTGDELFVLNPITWQNLNITPTTYNITKTWMYSGDDYAIGGDDIPIPAPDLAAWNNTATERRDNYMEWLLTPTVPEDIVSTVWTQFSFDLIQLWIKNFEIHIDVAELLNFAQGSSINIAAAFGGIDLETYLFTHHLAGAFLYNDSMPQDGKLSVNYAPLRYQNGTAVAIENSYVEVPQSSELTHRIILGEVGNFTFEKPVINPLNKSISWGLRLQDVNISAVPVGIDLDSYLKAPEDNLDYIFFGFTFEPLIDPVIGAAKGVVKLDQFFAPWNNNTAPYSNADIAGLDLAIIYVSTSLYFHLNIATQGEDPADPKTLLDPSQDYNNVSHEVKIGNYLGGQTKLDFIDIAGPYYEFGSDIIKGKANASTSIIPLALWTGEMERHETFVAEDGDRVETFATDIRVQREFNVMVYAISYPEFEDGTGIWHDPTFSVYMVFESEEFWAIIVLIAGVGLVGVATVLIKRRKDRRF